MKHRELTEDVSAAKVPDMQGYRNRTWSLGRRGIAAAVLAGGALALGGCVSVNAPDKPIVIELNINIKQDVVYRLAQDAGTTIDKNAGIF